VDLFGAEEADYEDRNQLRGCCPASSLVLLPSNYLSLLEAVCAHQRQRLGIMAQTIQTELTQCREENPSYLQLALSCSRGRHFG